MEFLARLKAYIEDQKLFQPHEKVLLAVSGGVDSVVLHHALHKLGYAVGIAHCNFQLRGEESDTEEQFVSDLARITNAPFFVRKFDTKQASESSNLSIQMAARELRYTWFEELRATHHYSCIAVAHHQNDALETVLLNLVRGTGLAGFHGILPRNGHIVRPLLFCIRQEIETYAKECQLFWHEDSSNASNKYARNLIRNEVIPLLKKINPSIEHTIRQTTEKIQLSERQLNTVLDKKRKKHVIWKNDIAQINIAAILDEENPLFILSSILDTFNFDLIASKQILLSAENISGKIFHSNTHRLIKDRKHWLVKQNNLVDFEPIDISDTPQKIKLPNGTLFEIAIQDGGKEQIEFLKTQNCHFFDFDKLHFPISIRKWKTGDFFQPFGMEGNKKISDLLVDQKISLFEKEDTTVLVSEEEIIAVIGFRSSNKHQVDENTKRIWVGRLQNIDRQVG